MGEYYDWVNVDRKEYISPVDFNLGSKRHESMGRKNTVLRALHEMAVSIATGSFRLSCPCGLNSGRHTGMRSSPMRAMPVKAGRSANAAANCLYSAAIGNSIAKSAALPPPGLQAESDSAVSGRKRSRAEIHSIDRSEPSI